MLQNIFIVLNLDNGCKYIHHTPLPLNKQWKQMLDTYMNENSSLSIAMRLHGIERFRIKILEECNDNKLQDRLAYWIEREQPEYNKTVLEHTTNSFDNKKSYREGKRKWGYNRKKKPSNKRTNTIKCRNLETGKIKTFHGWAEAAAFIGRGKYTQDIIIR